MTVRKEISKLLRVTPTLTNQELSELTGVEEQTIKTTLWRMKNRNEIQINQEKGLREVQFNEDEKVEIKEFKNDTYLELANQLIEASKTETNSYEIRQNGKLLVRILEKL